jgi:tripartite-type tricarboxylate transporter receptor subunit TctC
VLPAGTPAPVVEVLQSACERAARSAGYLEYANRAGQVVDYQPGAAFERKLQRDSQAKAATIRRLGL